MTLVNPWTQTEAVMGKDETLSNPLSDVALL